MEDQLVCAVKRLKEGDKQAFDEIFQFEYAKVFARVKTCMVGFCESDIEDVVQDVFVKVYEKIDTLENESAFEGWLSRIARNTAINEIEKRKKTTLFQKVSEEEYITEEDLLENEYLDFKPEESLSQKEIEENLFAILNEIPPHLSMCLQMKEYDGLSYQEISNELEIPISTVKNNIFQCKKKIKEEMKKRKLYCAAPILYFLWLYKSYMEDLEIPTTNTNSMRKAITKIIATEGKVSVGKKVVNSIGKKIAVATTVATIGTLGTVGVQNYMQPEDITPLITQYEDDSEDEYGNQRMATEEEVSKKAIAYWGLALTPENVVLKMINSLKDGDYVKASECLNPTMERQYKLIGNILTSINNFITGDDITWGQFASQVAGKKDIEVIECYPYNYMYESDLEMAKEWIPNIPGIRNVLCTEAEVYLKCRYKENEKYWVQDEILHLRKYDESGWRIENN